ncbi:unnamed protein product [Phaedon cochleariae]|uniref:Uncharacterized protein n=1 Tax=Phaedon cochleariae TaxID=80249 RepID=A0A9N9SAB7_PHACE|nr:unnamed protein product [Phaedon cochleariae]
MRLKREACCQKSYYQRDQYLVFVSVTTKQGDEAMSYRVPKCVVHSSTECSKEALPNKNICRQDNGGAEDVEMGKCLIAVNVTAGDSRDPEHRGRFFAFAPTHHLIPGHVDKSFWYWQYIFYNESQKKQDRLLIVNIEPLLRRCWDYNQESNILKMIAQQWHHERLSREFDYFRPRRHRIPRVIHDNVSGDYSNKAPTI